MPSQELQALHRCVRTLAKVQGTAQGCCQSLSLRRPNVLVSDAKLSDWVSLLGVEGYFNSTQNLCPLSLPAFRADADVQLLPAAIGAVQPNGFGDGCFARNRCVATYS